MLLGQAVPAPVINRASEFFQSGKRMRAADIVRIRRDRRRFEITLGVGHSEHFPGSSAIDPMFLQLVHERGRKIVTEK